MTNRIMPLGVPCLAGVAIAVLVGFGPAPGSAPAVAPQDEREDQRPGPAVDREDDTRVIRATMEAFVRAFNAADAGILAGLWTEEGEYHGEDGVTIRGRAALGRAFASYFEESPGATAELRPRSLRFLSRDSALDLGEVTIRTQGASSRSRAAYSALLVREDGRWRLALLEEATDDRHSVEELDWLVGEWESTDKEGSEVSTRYSWNSTKTWLLGHFTVAIGDRTLDGLQVIGVDPLTGGIRSWTFEAEGGIGEADWERDGDHWTSFAEGTLADGATMTATNILRRVDDDTFTFQSIGRAIDDEPLPDLPPVRVTRARPSP